MQVFDIYTKFPKKFEGNAFLHRQECDNNFVGSHPLISNDVRKQSTGRVDVHSPIFMDTNHDLCFITRSYDISRIIVEITARSNASLFDHVDIEVR